VIYYRDGQSDHHERDDEQKEAQCIAAGAIHDVIPRRLADSPQKIVHARQYTDRVKYPGRG